MFSSRFHWDLRPNRLTQALAERRAAGAAVLDLTASNPTAADLNYPAALTSALCDVRALLYEPAPRGLPAARTAVAEYYRGRGIEVDPERILLTASTSEGYAYLFKLLTDPGDEVLVPRPSYPLFEYLATMESVVVRQYPLQYHGRWSIDMEALAREVNSRTRAIVIVNPNNPTGSYVKRAELAALVDLCRERGLALISDEVFADYAITDDGQRAATVCRVDGCLAFAMSGLSKVAGLPQMKLGWIVVNGPESLRRESMEKLEWIADTYLSVSAPVQQAAATLLAEGSGVQWQIAARTRGNLEWLRAQVAGTPVELLDVEGGWYGVLRVPRVRSEEEWTLELLTRHGVLVQPGFFYDFESEAFLVVSALTPETEFRTGAYRILELAVK